MYLAFMGDSWNKSLFLLLVTFGLFLSSQPSAAADTTFYYTGSSFAPSTCNSSFSCVSGNVTIVVALPLDANGDCVSCTPSSFSFTANSTTVTNTTANLCSSALSGEVLNGVMIAWTLDVFYGEDSSCTAGLVYQSFGNIAQPGIAAAGFDLFENTEVAASGMPLWGQSLTPGTWSSSPPSLASSAVSVTSSANPSVSGDGVTFTATVTGNGATPTGSVTFTNGSAELGSGTLSAGRASFTTASLPVGSDSITAAYSGDGAFAPSTSAPLTEVITAQATVLAASVLPGSRSVQLGNQATIFATLLNSGTAPLDNCGISLPSSAPAGLTMSYQTTNPATNALTGTPNTPVTIAGGDGFQTFVLTFQSTAAFTAPGLALDFDCDGTSPATTVIGVDTVDLTVSSTPIADIIALALTPTQNGIIEVPNGGTAAFAVASENAGATGQIIASVDTGSASLPVPLTLCQSNPSNGQCLAPPTATVSLNFAAGATPTFSIFLQANGTIPFSPGASRVFVRFKDSSGGLHGSTSVAIKTQ